MNKKIIIPSFTMLAICLSLTGCGAQAERKTEAKSYKTLELNLTDAKVSQKYSASIRGEQFVDIRPQISGVITNILINEGAQIKAGQTLFIIDQVPYKAALDVAIAGVKSAESNVATAELNAKSSQALYDEQVISENELLIAQNTLASAEAALALANAEEVNARNNLSYTTIKSPVSGVASMISYRVGALVSSSITDPLVSVTNNENMNAYFSMSESQILTLSAQSGSTEQLIEDMGDVELVLNNGALYSHTGRVNAISGTIDRTTGAVSLRAGFENPEEILRDGGNGNIVIHTQLDSVIVIPKVATYELQNLVFAFRVIDGKAVSTEIQVYPLDNGNEYIVTSGLKAGEVIVAEGAGLLREGTVITPSKGAAPAL
ncbi:MAG: efflux RND transporter periplasmic adaptor subunit [Rikenellaceae bacterium]